MDKYGTATAPLLASRAELARREREKQEAEAKKKAAADGTRLYCNPSGRWSSL